MTIIPTHLKFGYVTLNICIERIVTQNLDICFLFNEM